MVPLPHVHVPGRQLAIDDLDLGHMAPSWDSGSLRGLQRHQPERQCHRGHRPAAKSTRVKMEPMLAAFSRISRELSKCSMLCVFSVWKVKSLQLQLVTTSKKRKLSDNLFTEELQEDEPVVHDWENYLDRLQILLLAYALQPLPPHRSLPWAQTPRSS